MKLFPSISAPHQCENGDVQMGSGQYKPNKLSQLIGQECLAVFVCLRDSFFWFVGYLLWIPNSSRLSLGQEWSKIVVVFVEDVLLKDSKSSHLPFLQVKNTTKYKSVIGIKENEVQLQFSLVITGKRSQVWALSCYPLCQPPHKPTTSMQWCTLASAQPRTFSWGCLARQWVCMLLSLSRQPKSFGHVLKTAQTQGAQLPSHCCSELLKYSPVV